MPGLKLMVWTARYDHSAPSYWQPFSLFLRIDNPQAGCYFIGNDRTNGKQAKAKSVMPIGETFEIIGPVTDIETIATGTGVDIRHLLNRLYGRATWRKKKRIAEVEYASGQIWPRGRPAEVHWYEAHAKGMNREKVKRDIRGLA